MNKALVWEWGTHKAARRLHPLTMLPRRGYEPLEGVDDDDEGTGDENKSPSLSGGNNSGRRNRSDYSPIVSPSSDDLTISVPDSDTIISDPNAHNSDSNKRGNPDKIGSDGGFKIRILDVQGQTYSLSVSAGMTVRELKVMLVDVAGVEVARQRIIYGGKVRVGVVLHLLYRASKFKSTIINRFTFDA